MSDLPQVAVIGMGGSITVLGRNRLDLFEYDEFGRTLTVAELLARVPEVSDLAEVVPIQLTEAPSNAIEPRAWLALNTLIHQTAATNESLSGIVVVHGTATLEETAYFLNLTVRSSVTIVVVGAMRPPTGLATDALANLLSAIRVAASPEARGSGVLVVLNDEIQAARDVSKTSTGRLQSLYSPNFGSLGLADLDGRIELYRRPRRRHAPDTDFDVRELRELPSVEIAYSYAGADGRVIDLFVQGGTRAIVSAGSGSGVTTPAEWQAILRARKEGVVVVQSSRVGSGRVMRRGRYRDNGVVAADDLNPQKARVLAMVSLTITDDPDRIQTFFDRY